MADMTSVAAIMVIAIIIIAVVIYKSISGGSKKEPVPPSGGGGGSGGGSIGGSVGKINVNPPVSTPPVLDEEHSVDRIYRCIYPTGMWICVKCECENDNGRQACRVCNCHR